MRCNGLRDFLSLLDAEAELARVRAQVDLDQELAAVCVKSLKAAGPALVFERPGGQDFPVVANLLATRRRYGLALECEPGDIHVEWNRRGQRPIPPVLVERGPCQEHVLLGDQVDLTRLPAPVWNALDGGPYLTLSCHHTRNPSTGVRNVGIYRNQVHDKRTLGLVAGAYTHIMLQRRGETGSSFPVAIAIGPDPRVVMAAAAPFPFGTDELAMAGAFRGEPVEVVRCKTVPLEVPADSEVVIEGEVRLDEERDEGLFGEITGHYGGPKMPRPVIHVTALTHRTTPMLHLAYQGAPPHETDVLLAVAREAEVMRSVTQPGMKAVHFTDGGCGMFHAVVSVEKLYEGYGKTIGLAVLGCPVGRYIKQVTVVDEDVDPFDPMAVEWAVATRVQADRDVEILRAVSGVFLDPSLPLAEQAGPSRTSKMIIDATRYDAKTFPAVCLPSASAMDKVDREWSRYGIPARRAEARSPARHQDPVDLVLAPLGIEQGPRM